LIKSDEITLLKSELKSGDAAIENHEAAELALERAAI